jgi:LPS export ABC transporter protein LptC
LGLDGSKLGGGLIRFIPWGVILLLWGCGKEGPPGKEEAFSGPDQVLERSTIIFTSEGRRTAVVYADRISKYLKGEKEVLQGVRTEFYDQEGRLSSTLTSREGIVFEGREKVEVKGEVVVITSEGLRLETPLLRWDSRANQVYTDSVVRISKGKDVVTGVGMEADPELKQIRLKGKVKGTIGDLPVDERL